MALVGPSGSGKSTIARLIASLWDVDSGSITLGGTDILRIPQEAYADKIAFVSQDKTQSGANEMGLNPIKGRSIIQTKAGSTLG